MTRLGIIGTNYGRMVQLPAFRVDPRCTVVALAGSNEARTRELAQAAKVPKAYGDWRALVEDKEVDAVAIAAPPALQAAIAQAALALGKPVFAEKPMTRTLAEARAMLRAAEQSKRPTMVDFTFVELPAWQKAKLLLDQGAIGRLSHFSVTWFIENYTTRMRLKHWKTSAEAGGGVLGNLISHSMHYLEWLGGPLAGLYARLACLPDEPSIEANATLALAFRSGASGSFAMCSASYRGSGHRLEFYGEDGTLVLANPTSDYMRGFTLLHGRRPDAPLAPVAFDTDPLDSQYPQEARVAPVARLAKRFLDAIETNTPVWPGFAEGCRVQQLIDAARRSSAQGQWIDLTSEQDSGESTR